MIGESVPYNNVVYAINSCCDSFSSCKKYLNCWSEMLNKIFCCPAAFATVLLTFSAHCSISS